ncbi:MAG: YafY family transcriptional regulator [Verrucomicrobiaceae bacterium]|nr:YafY family transcriptional regulator [Verrucomicrobiaceae bacterium]
MNRTDRLVAMVMMLQSRRVTTAAEMAGHFEITERTVYRDIAALGESGVPIVGEPGVGYSLMRGYHLPPVMFSSEEAFALITGGLLTERMTDGSMREATRSAIGKVTAVLPARLQERVERVRKTTMVRGRTPQRGAVSLSTVQEALAEGRVLELKYHGVNRDVATSRTVEPLGLVFYLDHWHLFAWCRLREEVRDFRVDRILQCRTLTESIPPRPGISLAGHLERCMTPERTFSAVIDLPLHSIESARRYWGPTLIDEQRVGKSVRVRFALGPDGLDSLARWLLGLGTDADIVEPSALAEKVRALALATANHHHQQKKHPAVNHS